MKKFLLYLSCTISMAMPAYAETVTLEGSDYEVTTLIDREIGPGIRHSRYRLPSYPLNINVVTVDMTNPYNKIETTTANERSKGTETLVNAAKRQSSEGHRAVAGANANFWVVASQPEDATYTGIVRNASVRNGKMIVESNQHRDKWDGGTMRTGVVSVSHEKLAYVDYCTSSIKATADVFGSLEIHQVNKGIHTDELCMYNSFYGSSTAFMPIKVDSNGKYQHDEAGDATEVLLDIDAGQEWDSNTDISFTVKEIRLNAGKGTLGSHDMALVGRGDNREQIAKLKVGDKVTLKYTWTYNPGDADEVTPHVAQAIGGNALVMRNGELTKHNNNETYNSQVYSRTGYGCSADGKKLYIIVIDKSTDPVYGTSAGCNTAKMCEFARWLGCSNMANFDAGGSAEMFINGKIENRTTEGTPRAVANGWLVYSTAPENNEASKTVSRLEFDDIDLQAPIYGSFTPTIIAYNEYGAVLDYDFKDFELSCDASLGSCNGNSFTAAGAPCKGLLTATYNGISVSREMTVLESQLSLRIKPLLIDGSREYPIEVVANIGERVYSYDPATINWSIEDSSIATIDEQGVLRGVAEGTTSYTATLGNFNDTADVTVEIAPAAEMSINNWADWTISTPSGIANSNMTADGTLSFTYNSPRDPYVHLAAVNKLYSIPDGIYLEFTPSVDIKYITTDFRTPSHSKANTLNISPTGDVFEKGKTHLIELPISDLGDSNDLALYPLTLYYLRFYIKANSEFKGEQNIKITKFYALYNNYSSLTVNTIGESRILLSPNPVSAGSTFIVKNDNVRSVEIYNNAGAKVSASIAPGEGATITAPSVAGTYVVRITTTEGFASSILIVK